MWPSRQAAPRLLLQLSELPPGCSGRLGRPLALARPHPQPSSQRDHAAQLFATAGRRQPRRCAACMQSPGQPATHRSAAPGGGIGGGWAGHPRRGTQPGCARGAAAIWGGGAVGGPPRRRRMCCRRVPASWRRTLTSAPSPSLSAGEMPGSDAFNAKYVPFEQVASGKSSGEEYSLDEVLYRARGGGLLDVQVRRCRAGRQAGSAGCLARRVVCRWGCRARCRMQGAVQE